MTLEQYLKHELAEGKIDFWFRAAVHDGQVELYIHPANKSGQTTPTLIVEGDTVRAKYPWPADDHDVARFEDEGNPHG